MINNIYPHIYNNEYLNISPKGLDNIMIFNNRKEILLEETFSGISFPNYEECKKLNICEDLIYLFSIDDKRFFLCNTIIPQFNQYKYFNIQIVRYANPRYLSFAGITSYQLNNWYSRNKYCGKCGNKMHHGNKSRTMICDKCSDTRYPFLAPAVIVGIVNKDKMLLTKYANSNHKKFALVAGYSEIGESVEDTVRREVMEEVGLKVKNIQYYKSQPWSFSGSLLFGFFCELDGSDKITLDENELSTAIWVSRDDIEEDSNIIALTADMIQSFKKNTIKVG